MAFVMSYRRALEASFIWMKWGRSTSIKRVTVEWPWM